MSEKLRNNVFVQWKGTNACFDFTCDCDVDEHMDGYTFGLIECKNCQKKWKLNAFISAERVME